MQITKLQGSGNDFVALSNLDGELDSVDVGELARSLCPRRTSVGADGLMVAARSERADFAMVFHNADGTPGEMCGNGVICFSRFLAELGHPQDEYLIETASGLITTWALGGGRYRVKLARPSVRRSDVAVTTSAGILTGDYVELGTPGLPHFVVELPNLDQTDAELRALGSEIRHADAFPKGANVNFYRPIAPNHVAVRTYERGVEDLTLACGTGSGSVGLVVAAASASETDISVDCPGGTLGVSIVRTPDDQTDIYLTGRATLVFHGTVADEIIPAPYS